MKFTVITATYNSANTIAECIDSINAQTHKDIEHIIIDGASKDETLKIVTSMSNRLRTIVSEPDEGIYDALNKGIKLAKGDIVGFLNSDDKFYSSTVIEQINDCFERFDIDCTYGNLVYINKENEVLRKWKSKAFKSGLFSNSWSPAHPTFYCKKNIYEKFGYYKSDYKIAADVELMLRFLEVHKIKFHFINEYQIKMLAGGISNQGVQSTITITKEVQRAFDENGLKFSLLRYLLFKGLKLKEFISS